MYDHVLVPVSFEAGRPARAALQVANALAADQGRITLLHVMEQLPGYAAQHLPAGHGEKARADIAAGLGALAEDVPGASVEVVQGHPARTIVDWADDHGVDCIVIASHRPGMQDLLLGSTAARVVRHAACSVHVVR